MSIRTITALLEECVVSGDKGPDKLWAWFLGEREVIKEAIQESNLLISPGPICSNCDQPINICGGCDNVC